ncbi:MAG: DUF3450 domain-containing protein [Gammaproteobacteria bacterium]
MKRTPMTVSHAGLLKTSFAVLSLLASSHSGWATHLQTAESLQLEKQKKAQASQQRVEKLDDQAQKMLDEFREASLELENIRAYHNQLAKIVQSQEQERHELERQMLDIEITQRNITPLMLRMLEVLEQFVELDAPFLEKERSMRVAHLKQMMDRSDVELGEKFRRLLEAYMIETDYGRTIEAFSGELELQDKKHTVDFLRLGRLGLYYLTLDQSEAGYWDKREQRWQVLDDSYRSAIGQGLRIAKKQAAPDLLQLPVSAPEQVQ